MAQLSPCMVVQKEAWVSLFPYKKEEIQQYGEA